MTFDGINSTASWHPNALLSEISKLYNLPLQHRAIKGLVKRMCSKCNQAKQSFARMTDIMERAKTGLLIIAHQYSNNKPFHSPNIPFLGNETVSTNDHDFANVVTTFKIFSSNCLPFILKHNDCQLKHVAPASCANFVCFYTFSLNMAFQMLDFMHNCDSSVL